MAWTRRCSCCGCVLCVWFGCPLLPRVGIMARGKASKEPWEPWAAPTRWKKEIFVPGVIWSLPRWMLSASLPMGKFSKGGRVWTRDLWGSTGLSPGWCLCTENKVQFCYPAGTWAVLQHLCREALTFSLVFARSSWGRFSNTRWCWGAGVICEPLEDPLNELILLSCF